MPYFRWSKSNSYFSGNTDNEITLDDDDDVIVVPQDEPVITEIPDDDDEEGKNQRIEEASISTTGVDPTSSAAKEDEKAKSDEDVDNSFNNESDVQILEPQISVCDLDEIEDLPEDETAATGEADTVNQLQVKIKEEPKYDGYADENEDDAFEDVGTFEGEAIGIIDDGNGRFQLISVFNEKF